MAHLAGLGHRRVAFLSGPRRLTSVRDRLEAYTRAVADHGLEPDDELLREGDFGERSGYEEATELLRLRRPPTAIFAANDRMAMGALAAASDHGRSVPDDVSVVGFDDVPMASFVRPALTTVALPTYDMGVAAMRLLLELMERSDGGRADPPVKGLPLELVVRASTAPPGGAPRGDAPGGPQPPATNGKEHDR
jgi:LacI family repressor for deo operon, udp, cdd, tsx, nupC, and nupG